MNLQEQISKIKGMMRINETQSSMLLGAINKDMMEIGEQPLDMEEMDDLLGCREEEPENIDQEQMSIFQKIKSIINSSESNKPLKEAFKQIKGLLKSKKGQQQEQLETMVILGVSAPVAALIVVGGLLLITILIKMIKNLGGDREYVPSCKQGLKAVRERRSY